MSLVKWLKQIDVFHTVYRAINRTYNLYPTLL